VVIAHKQKAKVLLGSATPAIETYYNALTGRYGLVTMKQRFGNAQLPDIRLIDVKYARKNKEVKGDFSNMMLDAIRLNFEQKEQTILFQNRRGYSPYIQCDDCDTIVSCPNCDVSLTYHYREQELRCHYCGYHESMTALVKLVVLFKEREVMVLKKSKKNYSYFSPKPKSLVWT
jgi:primosomal protein N' (replication factor Y)